MIKKKKTNKGAPYAGPTRTQPDPPPAPKGTGRNPVPNGSTNRTDKRRAGQGISPEKYEEMADAFFEVQSVNYVATSCEVRRETARKYIDKGDPKRGLEAIRDRFKRVQKKLNAKKDRTFEKMIDEWKAMILGAKGIVSEGLKDIMSDPQKKEAFIENLRRNPKMLVDIMSTLLRDESFAFGGPDSRTEVRGSTFSDLSDEELDEYIRTGVMPPRKT